MRTLDYQRLVVGYHGCDASVLEKVISEGGTLVPSRNDHDWLGSGIYFWEHGPTRAYEWAAEQRKRKRLEKPAVVGAPLHLGQCFDLLDSAYTDVLVDAYPEFCRSLEAAGRKIPRNEALNEADPDRILRRLDCAAVNWTISELESGMGGTFQSVRGVFQEGEPVFPDSGIRRRSHIQIAVRDPTCILGYFLPSSEG